MIEYTALGAYIFAGGFTVGVQNHFKVDLHLEGDTYGKKVKDMNLPHVDTEILPWPEFTGYYDFIYCNPPCAPFSSASNGRKTTWDQDPRISCFNRSFWLIDNGPRFLAIESVLQAWRKASKYILDLALVANSMGYGATVILHDGQYLGLPQQRRRMFLVLHLDEIAWHTHQPKPQVACDWALLNPPLTGLDWILSPCEHTQNLLHNRRPNDNTLVHIHDRITANKGFGSRRPVYTSSLCRPGRPAPTLLHAMHGHPTEPRYLTVREMARLSGYPDWWNWDTGTGPQSKASLIARGVTPTVGEWLAALVKASLDWEKPAKAETRIADVLKGHLNLSDPVDFSDRDMYHD